MRVRHPPLSPQNLFESPGCGIPAAPGNGGQIVAPDQAASVIRRSTASRWLQTTGIGCTAALARPAQLRAFCSLVAAHTNGEVAPEAAFASAAVRLPG